MQLMPAVVSPTAPTHASMRVEASANLLLSLPPQQTPARSAAAASERGWGQRLGSSHRDAVAGSRVLHSCEYGAQWPPGCALRAASCFQDATYVRSNLSSGKFRKSQSPALHNPAHQLAPTAPPGHQILQQTPLVQPPPRPPLRGSTSHEAPSHHPAPASPLQAPATLQAPSYPQHPGCTTTALHTPRAPTWPFNMWCVCTRSMTRTSSYQKVPPASGHTSAPPPQQRHRRVQHAPQTQTPPAPCC